MGKKILVVDDEADYIQVVSVRLKANGYEVITAMDGAEGFEKAKKDKPDLIILDLMLPKIDGFKVCGLLKKDARYAKTPIVIFTARAQEEDRLLCEEMGADAYLTKPFEAKILLDKIQSLIGE